MTVEESSEETGEPNQLWEAVIMFKVQLRSVEAHLQEDTEDRVAETRVVDRPVAEIYKALLYPHWIILIGFEFNSASGLFTVTTCTCCINLLQLQPHCLIAYRYVLELHNSFNEDITKKKSL